MLAHGVVEVMKREVATIFKSLATRWHKRWKVKNGEWKGQIRWSRVQMGRAQRRCIFSWSDTFCRSNDSEADALDAYYQAPEHEDVVVEPAPEYLERLTKAGRDWET